MQVKALKIENIDVELEQETVNLIACNRIREAYGIPIDAYINNSLHLGIDIKRVEQRVQDNGEIITDSWMEFDILRKATREDLEAFNVMNYINSKT